MQNTVSLKKNRDFGRIYRNSKYHVGKFIILYANPNRFGFNRLGITTSKKVGKSVRRNRLRRLVRENYRLYENIIKTSFDLVFVVRKTEILPSNKEIKREMKYLLKKASLLEMEQVDDS